MQIPEELEKLEKTNATRINRLIDYVENYMPRMYGDKCKEVCTVVHNKVVYILLTRERSRCGELEKQYADIWNTKTLVNMIRKIEEDLKDVNLYKDCMHWIFGEEPYDP